MEIINLKAAIPEVFAQRTDIMSDVWLKDLSFEKNKCYLIEANSGTGKSSLCSYVYGYRKDYQGRIFFDEQNIRELNIKAWVEIRKKHLSLEEWFDRLGIDDKKNVLVGRMSFGQQQRVALIRALCQPFDFIFVDEPISHLDDSNSQIMAELLKEEVERQGAGLVATSIGKRMELPYDAVLRL